MWCFIDCRTLLPVANITIACPLKVMSLVFPPGRVLQLWMGLYSCRQMPFLSHLNVQWFLGFVVVCTVVARLIIMLFSLCCAYLGQRTAWSQEELTFLRDHFASLKRPPNFAEVRSAVRLMPALRKRSLPQIKTRVWALLRMWTVSTCSLYLEAILAVQGGSK